MEFTSFLVLLVVSAVVSAILHYGFKFYVTPGTTSFLSKIVVGWLGAWVGTLILGNWFEPLVFGGIYFVPAVLGSVSALIVAVDIGQMWAGGGEKK